MFFFRISSVKQFDNKFTLIPLSTIRVFEFTHLRIRVPKNLHVKTEYDQIFINLMLLTLQSAADYGDICSQLTTDILETIKALTTQSTVYTRILAASHISRPLKISVKMVIFDKRKNARISRPNDFSIHILSFTFA